VPGDDDPMVVAAPVLPTTVDVHRALDTPAVRVLHD
jgi:hypothetical protein